MFALLQKSQGTPEPSEPILWQQTVISADGAAQQQQAPSFLDRLAAPTVFLQQALVFQDTTLDTEALKAAVAALLHLYPPFGHRLSSSQVGGGPFWVGVRTHSTLVLVSTSPKWTHEAVLLLPSVACRMGN